MMHITTNEFFEYKAPNGVDSWCIVDVFLEDRTMHVVFSEPPEGDSGMSVTNAIETVIKYYHNIRLPQWDFDSIRWFERYVYDEETLDEVTVDSDYENPRWKRVDNSLFSFS